MKKLFFGCVAAAFPAFLNARPAAFNDHIQNDTTIKWTAVCNKVINLANSKSEYDLKKWYLNKLKKESVVAYNIDNNNQLVSQYKLSLPALQQQDWLKGLDAEMAPYKNPKEWYFVDKTMPASDYTRAKFRAGGSKFSTDSCCGCDGANAFRARQVLNYANGQFSIYNVFISPLCARQTAAPPLEWYPLCNVAYNNADLKFPGISKDVILLNTDEADYEFNSENSSPFDSVLTAGRGIGSLIYQDALSGRVKVIEIETGELIPAKKMLTWKMPADTVAVYDVNDASQITRYDVKQRERSINDFSRFRIKQDFYFDFKNEKLYSVIRSIIIFLPVRSYDGSIRGYIPFCKIQ